MKTRRDVGTRHTTAAARKIAVRPLIGTSTMPEHPRVRIVA